MCGGGVQCYPYPISAIKFGLGVNLISICDVSVRGGSSRWTLFWESIYHIFQNLSIKTIFWRYNGKYYYHISPRFAQIYVQHCVSFNPSTHPPHGATPPPQKKKRGELCPKWLKMVVCKQPTNMLRFLKYFQNFVQICQIFNTARNNFSHNAKYIP